MVREPYYFASAEAVGMDSDELWTTIDAQRTGLADLLAELTPEEWEQPSWCAGWRVRDVAAHLTLAQATLAVALPALLRARGSFDRMVHDTAVARATAPPEELVGAIRAMVGSRRRAPVVTEVEPLLTCWCTGRTSPEPLGPGPAAVPPRRPLRSPPAGPGGWARRSGRDAGCGTSLVATDSELRVGSGLAMYEHHRDLLLLVTGRRQVVRS